MLLNIFPAANRHLRLIIVALCLLWLATLFLSMSKLSATNSAQTDAAAVAAAAQLRKHAQRLAKALDQADMTRLKLDEMRSTLDEHLGRLDAAEPGQELDNTMREIEAKVLNSMRQELTSMDLSKLAGASPPPQYEVLRRHIEDNIKEFWYFTRKIIKEATLTGTKNNLVLLEELKGSLVNDMSEMRRLDGYEMWRNQEAQELSALVQRRLHYLQNPTDCKKARKLVCNLNKGCGYGCQIHHVVYCFIMAYATERTLIVESNSWRYNKKGWTQVFQPVSETCQKYEGTRVTYPGHPEDPVLSLPIIDSLDQRPPQLPLAVPADLAPRISSFHGSPIVWWIGQFLKYLIRFQPTTQSMIDEAMVKLKFQKPIVGVHIRRTDKVGTEATSHRVEEYMVAVDEYYRQLEMREPVDVRRVFIASDDERVIDEARQKYPHYQVIGDPAVAKSASLKSRYSDKSLNGIILDIHMLSISDHLVCTFSSQVCRMAYEIMQTLHTDASTRFTSLDDIYYYGGQNAHVQEAVLPHKPLGKGEVALSKGDPLGIAGNHWDGYSKGRNKKTNKEGLIPSFKIIDKVQTADFPTYSHVK